MVAISSIISVGLVGEDLSIISSSPDLAVFARYERSWEMNSQG